MSSLSVNFIFPSAVIVRTYVNRNHKRDLTAAQRKFISNILGGSMMDKASLCNAIVQVKRDISLFQRNTLAESLLTLVTTKPSQWISIKQSHVRNRLHESEDEFMQDSGSEVSSDIDLSDMSSIDFVDIGSVDFDDASGSAVDEITISGTNDDYQFSDFTKKDFGVRKKVARTHFRTEIKRSVDNL